MPTYLWTAKNGGVEVAEKVTAPTAQLARELLEKRGWTDLKLLHDDLMAELTAKNDLVTKLPAEKQAEFIRKGKITFHEYVLKIVKDVGLLALACGVGMIWKWSRQEYWGVLFFALPVVITTMVFARIRLHGYLFTRLVEASEWHRADETLRLLQRLTKFLKPEDVSFFRSAALIRKGHVSAGLADWQQHEAKLSPWFYLCRLSSLYEAAEVTDRAIELSEKALALNPNTSALYIDLAWRYLLYERNLPRAKDLTEQAERLEQSELVRPFLIRNRGIVALREGRFEEAERLLLESLAIWDANKGATFRYSSTMITKGFLSQVRAKLGKVAQARADFEEAREWLEAVKLTPILKACEAYF